VERILDCAVRDTMGLNFLWLDLAKRDYDAFSISGHKNWSKDYSPV
jgi:hypothetical protein